MSDAREKKVAQAQYLISAEFLFLQRTTSLIAFTYSKDYDNTSAIVSGGTLFITRQ